MFGVWNVYAVRCRKYKLACLSPSAIRLLSVIRRRSNMLVVRVRFESSVARVRYGRLLRVLGLV